MGDDAYMLNDAAAGAGETERKRLDKQFFVLNEVMEGNLLPPHIAKDISDNPAPRICDMATGSAIWLRELAKTLPLSAELFGYDYDTSKFPKDGLPRNVKLGTADLYEPFPKEWEGTFDVVSLRLFYLAAQKDKIFDMLRNLSKLLRPGGWFVWCDLVVGNASMEPPSDSLFRFLKALYAYFMKAGIDTSIPIGTLRYLKEVSLVECDDKIRSLDSGVHRLEDAEWLDLSRWLFHRSIMAIGSGIVRAGRDIDGMKTQEDLDNLDINLVEGYQQSRKDSVVSGSDMGATGTLNLCF
ncbi:hypothetical protein F4782DRAFT_344302 [Xylaria castorea]|nr:hypothetical protein F4782DRAFT_344302 [Xylaria castorea]